MIKSLLVGPKLNVSNAFYGSGKGGYTRNMEMYIKVFRSENFMLIPFFATVRKKNEIKLFSFPMRFFRDMVGFTCKLIMKRPQVVHILGQYRGSILRAVGWVVLGKVFKKKIVYEIKAGQFISSIPKGGVKRKFYEFILNNCDHLLVEGKVYKSYLAEKWNLESTYFPNVVADDEINVFKRDKKLKSPLRVLFVGFAYEGKGIISGLEALRKIEFPVHFSIIGGESDEFIDTLEHISFPSNITIDRMGIKSHSEVLEAMTNHDIYLYPSKHLGEGHNNTINEALMSEMIIISSKAGLLEEVLNGVAFLLDEVTPSEIKYTLEFIHENQMEAMKKAELGKQKLVAEFTSGKLINTLERVYHVITNF